MEGNQFSIVWTREENPQKFPFSGEAFSLSSQSEVDWDKVLLAIFSQKKRRTIATDWLTFGKPKTDCVMNKLYKCQKGQKIRYVTESSRV